MVNIWQTFIDFLCNTYQGPTATCKHVVAVLQVLVKFVSDGTLDIQGSCTDQLMSFKRPKKQHTGAPVPAEQLGKKSYSVKNDDDPRPEKYRNRPSYNDELFNATINFAANSGIDISWRYWQPDEDRKPADLAKAQKDHDYLDKPVCNY